MILQRNTFGRLGDSVSRLGFGAWAIGGLHYGEVSRIDADQTINAYVEAGGNFIDTAQAYGISEEILGDYLSSEGLRRSVFLCSKTGATDEKEIRSSLENSLRKLKTDVIDLYYIHNPPSEESEMEHVLAVYRDLKKEGKIRGIGASVKGPNVTSETQELCLRYIDSGDIDAIQLIYSIFRQKNDAVFETAGNAGVALVGRTALESGFLTGKYKPGHRFHHKDHRNRWSPQRIDEILKNTERLRNAKAAGYFGSLSEMAIRFAYDESGLQNVIVGARTEKQMASNLKAAGEMMIPDDWRRELIERYGEPGDLGNF